MKKLTEEHKKKIAESHRGKKKSEEHRKNLSQAPWNKGKKGVYTLSQETRRKISLSLKGRIPENLDQLHKENTGSKNSRWKGNKVSYSGLHHWVTREKGKASYCEFADETCNGGFEWSNISNKYYRNLEDWQQLCKSHHRRYDKKRRIECAIV